MRESFINNEFGADKTKVYTGFHVETPQTPILKICLKTPISPTDLFPNPANPMLDNLIVYAIDHEEKGLLFGPRFIQDEMLCPLFLVDLHLNQAKCLRCQKIEHYIPILGGDETGEQIERQTYDQLKIIHDQNHMDCERPICLN